MITTYTILVIVAFFFVPCSCNFMSRLLSRWGTKFLGGGAIGVTVNDSCSVFITSFLQGAKTDAGFYWAGFVGLFFLSIHAFSTF